MLHVMLLPMNLTWPLVDAVEQTAPVLSSSETAEHTALDNVPVVFVVHHMLEEDHKVVVHQGHKRTVLDRTLLEEHTADLAVDIQVVHLEACRICGAAMAPACG